MHCEEHAEILSEDLWGGSWPSLLGAHKAAQWVQESKEMHQKDRRKSREVSVVEPNEVSSGRMVDGAPQHTVARKCSRFFMRT